MQNPFESGHIKNYILMYVSVVVIMILFFLAATLLRDVEVFDKKSFETKEIQSAQNPHAALEEENRSSSFKFKLLEKGY